MPSTEESIAAALAFVAVMANPGVTATTVMDSGNLVVRMVWPSGEVWICDGATGVRLRVGD